MDAESRLPDELKNLSRQMIRFGNEEPQMKERKVHIKKCID